MNLGFTRDKNRPNCRWTQPYGWLFEVEIHWSQAKGCIPCTLEKPANKLRLVVLYYPIMYMVFLHPNGGFLAGFLVAINSRDPFDGLL